MVPRSFSRAGQEAMKETQAAQQETNQRLGELREQKETLLRENEDLTQRCEQALEKRQGAQQLMGQLLHLFESPNRFGLPAFYTLHVWAWKENPNGTFVNWHPKVSCDGFTTPNP